MFCFKNFPLERKKGKICIVKNRNMRIDVCYVGAQNNVEKPK